MTKLFFFVERQNYAVVLFLPFLVSISTQHSQNEYCWDVRVFTSRTQLCCCASGPLQRPLWLTKVPELWRSRLMVPAGVAAVSFIVSFPRLVNQDSVFYSVWTGGYFDKLLVYLGDFAHILVPLIWVPSLAYLFLCMLPQVLKTQLFRD